LFRLSHAGINSTRPSRGDHQPNQSKMLRATLLGLFGALSTATFRPHTVSYQDLESARGEHPLLRQALTDVGMVAISDIPGYQELRRKVLAGAHRCLQDLPQDDARGHIFEDGTERRTLAMAAAGEVPVHGDVASCAGLQDELKSFRTLVSSVSRTFAGTLGAMLNLGDEPLLASKSQGQYDSVESIFLHGDHLDHIHSYHLRPTHQGSAKRTMDLHTDQGLCIAFTPALLVEEDAQGVVQGLGKNAGKFQVQLRGGDVVEVDLRGEELIFMLGDGVNQYVNPKKLDGPELRAVPHALTMPQHAANEWRVWYGRMFLPPADAVNEDYGMTYGEMKDMLTEAWVTEDEDLESHLTLGCSGGKRAQELRELDEVAPPCSSGARRRCSGSCANNQLQCWWRCMNFTELESTCSSDEHVNCTNRRNEISVGGVHHGDYDLTCTSSTQLVRGNCELEQINADRPDTCNSAGFETFLTEQSTDVYDGRHVLLKDADGQPEVVFLSGVTDGKVVGMMAFNGKLAWMAIGIENRGASKNGMQGARVVLGMSAHDQEMSNLAGTVKEYKIHDSESRLRHWNTPYSSPAVSDSEMVEESCYTAMKFTTDSIFGESLNVTSGANRLIWALRASTYMHIGKDSYHEGCAGEERTRYRGGGAANPWSVTFSAPEDVNAAHGRGQGGAVGFLFGALALLMLRGA